MLAARVTPGFVTTAMIVELALLIAIYLPSALGYTHRFKLAEAIVMTAAGLVSFGIATLLCFEVAAEYRQSNWANWAWQLLGISSALSLLKRLVGSPMFDLVISNYRSGPLRGLLDNGLFVPANLCLLLGLVAMWWALHKTGLGFKIARRDIAAMTGVAALFALLLVYRQHLSQGQSPYQISRILQPVGLMLLGFISAFGLVLHRCAVQMGDGRLAAVMRWLTLYVLLRGVLVISGAFLNPVSPLQAENSPGINEWLFDILWQIVPWIAALAAACRAQVTVSAAEQLNQLRSGDVRTAVYAGD